MPLLDLHPGNIIDEINTRHNKSYTAADLIFSMPIENNESWDQIKYPYNTLIRVSAHPDLVGVLGSVIVSYDRIPLGAIGKHCCYSCGIPDSITTVHEALPYLNKYIKIKFYESDILDGPLGTDINGNKTVPLVAADTSIGYCGSTIITGVSVPVDGALVLPVLTGYNFENYITQGHVEELTYSIDFGSEFVYLNTFHDSITDLTQIATILTSKTGETWSATDPDAGLSLLGAAIIYVGAAAAGNGNHAYQNLIKIELDRDLPNLTHRGTVFIHFNPDGSAPIYNPT